MEGIATSKEKITERFLEAMKCIIDKHELATQKAFAETIGVENHHISNLNIGKSHVNAWMIASFTEKYPEINPDYVLNGKGNITREVKPAFRTTQTMRDYIELIQEENKILRSQIEALQKLLLEKYT